MSSGGSLLQEWISDFCAPVVVVVATEEAERLCLQNGLLLHELLSCFGHLDGLNSVVRVGTQIINVADGHIRFERGTETKVKSPDTVEELLLNTFKPYQINHLPTNANEIKLDPPSSWTSTTEQIFLRSMAFSEYEMISHPVLILNVVAASDQEPVVAMQELASIHHTPAVFANGQYDNNVHRVFVLLVDAIEKKKDPLSILRGLNSYFPPAQTKLLSINSFPANAPNLQQPDMWSRHLIPKFFPNQAPRMITPLPVNPSTEQAVLGCRLSVEDFMKLREFCIWLFSDQILPILEKRINSLTRQVNDSRKGVKNVLKSFWRKPREETDTIKGGVKYRFDKIESQTLLLADLSFILKDYETALSMYRLVRDDYKSDKSNLHYVHSVMMAAICQIVAEPHKYREVYTILDGIAQVMLGGLEMTQAHAYFALLSSEIYVLHPTARSPLDSAKILLQASSSVAKYPLMSSLLIERAASFFLQSNQVRKFILHEVITGIKMHKIGKLPAVHATVCFAASILLLEKGNWGDLKSKLTKAISEDFKLIGREGAQRSLLFLLKILNSMIQESKEIGINSSLVDAISILNEILGDGYWGAIRVNEGWMDCSMRDIMLGTLPISPLEIHDIGNNVTVNEISKSRTEVYGLPVPEVLLSSVTMLEPINGYFFHNASTFDAQDKLQRSLLIALLSTEREWIENEYYQKIPNKYSLEESLIRAEKECIQIYENNSKQLNDYSEVVKVPCGERILVKIILQNKLPIDLAMLRIHLEVNENHQFEIKEQHIIVSGDTSQEIVLEIIPKSLGNYHITNLKWNLNEYFTVVQPIIKKGILLQKTIQQRAQYERTKEQYLKFQVIESNPLISLKFEGLSAEVLQGQLLKAQLILRNDGISDAHNIYLKLSQPSFVFYLNATTKLKAVREGAGERDGNEEEKFVPGKFLEFYGHSCTIVSLHGIVIHPGEEIRLEAWLRLTRLGIQKISLLASYQKEDPLSEKRYSYISIKTTGLPSLGLSMQLSNRVSSTHSGALITEMTNAIVDENEGKEIIRLSSIGQLDLPDFEEHFIDMDANCLKIVGLLMLGSGLPALSPALTSKTREKVFITAPTERISQVWPIQILETLLPSELKGSLLHDPENEDISSVENTAWLIKLPDIEIEHHPHSIKLSKSHLKLVVEQFLVIWYAFNDFTKKLDEARRLLMLEELEASNAGPRSIQDVRRERQKLTTIQAATDDGMETIIDNASADAKTGGEGSRKDAYCHQNHHITFNIQNIIRKERLNHSIGVTAIWVCRWQEKIRWGMHHIPFITMLSNLLPKETVLSSPSLYFNNSLAYLRVAVNHEREIHWKEETLHEILPVTVTIQSLSSNRVIEISIQGLPNQFSSIQKIFSHQEDEKLLLTKMANVGFAWANKTRYNKLQLKPKEMITLTFSAEIMFPGVHNLNRFGIISEFVDDDESHLDTTETTWTALPGTSFVAALPPADRERYFGNIVFKRESKEREKEVEKEQRNDNEEVSVVAAVEDRKAVHAVNETLKEEQSVRNVNDLIIEDLTGGPQVVVKEEHVAAIEDVKEQHDEIIEDLKGEPKPVVRAGESFPVDDVKALQDVAIDDVKEESLKEDHVVDSLTDELINNHADSFSAVSIEPTSDENIIQSV